MKTDPLRRRQMMMDQAVQGALIGRVCRYWLMALASLLMFHIVSAIWTTPGLTLSEATRNSVRELSAPAVASLLVLPLAIVDMVRLSSRFVGPVMELRRALRQHELGDDVTPLRIRNRDLWGDLIETANRSVWSRQAKCGPTDDHDPEIAAPGPYLPEDDEARPFADWQCSRR